MDKSNKSTEDTGCIKIVSNIGKWPDTGQTITLHHRQMEQLLIRLFHFCHGHLSRSCLVVKHEGFTPTDFHTFFYVLLPSVSEFKSTFSTIVTV